MEDIFDKIQAITGISKYSNSEVITPKSIVSDMVDLLPTEVFVPEARFLDPAVKSGRFLAEIYKRLMDSEQMAQAFPDQQVRRKYILENQLYGLATSPVAATVTRKALYDDPTITGNIVYIDQYLTSMLKKETDFHKLIEEEFGQMKFDVVIGNPPYQQDTGGGRCGGKPLYTKFVEYAFSVSTQYVVLIIPARWYIPNKDTRDFSETMINQKNIRKIVDFQNSTMVFEGVSIPGGVCYWLWDKTYTGTPQIITQSDDNITEAYRELHSFDIFEDTRQYPCFIRNNTVLNIVNKVKQLKECTFRKTCSNISPFGLKTNFSGSAIATQDYPIEVICSYDRVEYARISDITKGKEILPKFNIILNTISPDGGGELTGNSNQYYVIAKPKILKPNQACTLTYIVLCSVETEHEANNCIKYIKTKLVRTLIQCLIGSAYMAARTFQLVPLQDFTSNSDIDWSQSVADIDKQLYKKYGLTQEEIDYIESTIKPMS